MQIGCCWFDSTQRLLINQTSAVQWHLNDREYWVVSQLVQHRGQVVPLSILEAVAISADSPQPLSQVELLEIIDKITDYLCNNHSNLIEYVPDQGVILYAFASAKHTKIFEQPNKLLSVGQYLFIIVIILSVLLFVYSKLNPPELTQADVVQQILASDGRIVQLFVFGNNNPQDAQLHADCLSSQLRLCHHIRWDSINMTLSSNQHYVSFTLGDSTAEIPLVNSIKVNVDNMSVPFITQEWLLKVAICG